MDTEALRPMPRRYEIVTLKAIAALGASIVWGAAAAATPQAPPAASSGAAPRFSVQEYRVLGNTVLPNRAIETVL